MVGAQCLHVSEHFFIFLFQGFIVFSQFIKLHLAPHHKAPSGKPFFECRNSQHVSVSHSKLMLLSFILALLIFSFSSRFMSAFIAFLTELELLKFNSLIQNVRQWVNSQRTVNVNNLYTKAVPGSCWFRKCILNRSREGIEFVGNKQFTLHNYTDAQFHTVVQITGGIILLANLVFPAALHFWVILSSLSWVSMQYLQNTVLFYQFCLSNASK